MPSAGSILKCDICAIERKKMIEFSGKAKLNRGTMTINWSVLIIPHSSWREADLY
jgi:hypothetical protein